MENNYVNIKVGQRYSKFHDTVFFELEFVTIKDGVIFMADKNKSVI